MNNRSVFSSAFLVLALTASACAPKTTASALARNSMTGGGDSSGGDTRQMSHEELATQTFSIPDDLKLVFHRLEAYQAKNGDSIYPILNKFMSALPESPTQTLSRAQFRFEDNKDCIGDNATKDASVDKAGNICISLLRLGRFPSGSLTFQAVALGVHEISHMRGFNETDAQAIQDWVLQHPELNQDQNTRLAYLQALETLQTDAPKVAAALRTNSETSRVEACGLAKDMATAETVVNGMHDYGLPPLARDQKLSDMQKTIEDTSDAACTEQGGSHYTATYELPKLLDGTADFLKVVVPDYEAYSLVTVPASN